MVHFCVRVPKVPLTLVRRCSVILAAEAVPNDSIDHALQTKSGVLRGFLSILLIRCYESISMQVTCIPTLASVWFSSVWNILQS